MKVELKRMTRRALCVKKFVLGFPPTQRVCSQRKMMTLVQIIGLLSFAFQLAAARLNPGDALSVAMNKVSPFHNPLESYPYYEALPFCRPEKIEFESMSFGQLLRGDRLVNSLYALRYLGKQVKLMLACFSMVLCFGQKV